MSIVLVPLALIVLLALALTPPGSDPGAEPRANRDAPPPAEPRARGGFERRAERLEPRAAARPADPGLQRATIEAWFDAGHKRLIARDLSAEKFSTATRDDLRDGLRLADRYLRRVERKVDADFAETIAATSMEMAEIGSRDPQEVEEHVARAARTGWIAGREKRTLYTLSNVAIYAYFNGEYARGDDAAEGAIADTNTKRLHRIATRQLEGYRERSGTFRRLLGEAKAELRESGEELLDSPFQAYVHRVGLNKNDPTE